MGAEDRRRIDEKGRVTLPKEIRDRLGLEPGDRVDVSTIAGRIQIRPEGSVSRSEFIDECEGVITEERRSDRAPAIDPLDLKRDWVGDLPT